MEKQKMIIWIAIISALIVFIFIIAAVFFFNLGRKNMVNSLTDGNPTPAPQEEKVVVTEKEKIPPLVTGTVESVGADKITIKQFANFNISYELNKSDIGSLVMIKKNPSFDEQKIAEIQKEIQQKLKEKGIDLTNPPLDGKQIQLPEDIKALQNDPSLNPYTEENISWNDIQIGVQVNVATDDKGEKKLTVYPKEINIGPPENK